jgi:hypothetical protein
MSLEPNKTEKAIRLLQLVLQGNIKPETALGEWPVMTNKTDRLIGNAHHQLFHYFADEDIRSREPEYANAQRLGLQKCVDDLLAQLQNTDSR